MKEKRLDQLDVIANASTRLDQIGKFYLVLVSSYQGSFLDPP